MRIKDKKDDIINEIMNLRKLIDEIETNQNEDKVMSIQRHINKIHDMVFNI